MDIFHSQTNSFRVSAHESLKTKEKFKLCALKVSVAAYGNVRLREWVNTEFVWEFKRCFGRAIVSTAVRLRECLLKRAFTV